MEKFQSLADFLDAKDPRKPEDIPQSDFEQLIDVSDPKEFCQRIMKTREFRQYIMNGFVLGDIPAAIVGRIMDHGVGKPVEHIEHSGKIETVTEVRRVIVHASVKKDESQLDKVVH